MLSSRKTIKPRSLQGSTSRTILLGYSGTGHPSSSCLFFFRRELSWGSKHKDTTSCIGKVCKGSSTQDLSNKVFTRKQLYRSAFWGDHHLRGYLPKYAPVQEWRFLSYWRSRPETPSSLRDKDEANEEEDWYSRWEKQKLKQYDDFIKKVEQDPYAALFGKSWLSFSGDSTELGTKSTAPPDSPTGNSMPKNEWTRDSWPSKPNSGSSTKAPKDKAPKDRDTIGRQLKGEKMPIQEHDQEYEIDPITNHKIFKVSASPVSALGHTKPQIKDRECAPETITKGWNLVSPTPLNQCLTMADHEQVVSSSNPPSKGTPPSKPRNKIEWLAQEGFGGFKESKAGPQPTPHTRDAKPKTSATKIESALDRHLNSKSSNEKEKSDQSELQYKPEENKTEDIDLLRPSDVRASAGLRGNSRKETDLDKQERRKKLEERYNSCSPDRAEVASDKLMQKEESPLVRKNIGTELRFGSWLKGTLEDAELKSKEALKDKSANEKLDARDFGPESTNQKSNSTLLSKNKVASQLSNAIASEDQAKAREKADKLKAQVVPFKAKLDAMKADYDFLRQEWLQEIRKLKDNAAKKEEQMKALETARRAREIHEAEVKTQKIAMEAMEMRTSDRTTNTAKTALAGGLGKDDAEKPGPRRLQSFFQGEGDMASNVHEFAGRDRWYKRKAPHAMGAKDAENDAKLQKAARDRALICEIRGIYEDTYGTIDTKHRQLHDLPSSPMGIALQPITPSSGRVDAHAQLPSSAVGIADSSKWRNKSQISEALVIVQKLFGQLREAQSIIQSYQSHTKQTLDPNTQGTDMPKTPFAFEKSVMQVLKTSLRLARIRLDGMINQGSAEATAVASSKEPTIIQPPSTTAPKPPNLEIQKTPRQTTYCILAYDSASETVNSIETMVPFSKEESLLPLDALNRVSNPAKFLEHVANLGATGYEPVSGTANVLVFKKRRVLQDLDKIIDRRFGSWSESWPFDLTAQEDVSAQLRGLEAEQHKTQKAQQQAVVKDEREQAKTEKPSQTVTDDNSRENQPLEGTQKQQLASSTSPSHTSNDMVHRQETVFSGSRQSRWIDRSAKFKRSKRAADRRRKTMKRMLMTGAFTAACCYCVGVVSELMHG